MKQILRRHFTDLNGNETYEIKLKDKADQCGYKIWRKDSENMVLKEIRISKVPRENNRFVIELIK